MNKRNKLDYGFCPASPVLEWFSDKWNFAVLIKISQGAPIRFGELFRQIPDISEKMLSSTLHTLETDGLIDRHVFPEVPPRVEYSLTELGKGFIPHMENLMEWGHDNIGKILRNREKNTQHQKNNP